METIEPNSRFLIRGWDYFTNENILRAKEAAARAPRTQVPRDKI